MDHEIAGAAKKAPYASGRSPCKKQGLSIEGLLPPVLDVCGEAVHGARLGAWE
jgi:hypothetical protein